MIKLIPAIWLILISLLSSACHNDRDLSEGNLKGLSVFPGLIKFVRPNLDENLGIEDGVVEFEVWFDLDENGAIFEIGYEADNGKSKIFPNNDWRLKVVEATIIAARQWECTPLVIDGVATLCVVDIKVRVEVLKGVVCTWLIKTLEDDVIYNSAISADADCPLFL